MSVKKIAANSRRLARPDASHLIAHAIADQLGVMEGIIQGYRKMRNKEYLYTASNKGQNKTHLSVIIPTLNEIAYLPQLLDALAKQTRLPDEIIVADAGSKDGTAELAQSRGVRFVHGGMPAVGRNAGARAAKGDLLLFLDADVLPPPEFIERVLEEFERKKYDVATCFIASINGNPLDGMICVGTNLYFQIIQPVSPHAPGFCILSKRTAHEKMGGFDESLTLSEDIDYARRAKKMESSEFYPAPAFQSPCGEWGKKDLWDLA